MSKKEQKLAQLANTAAQLAKDEKFRDAADSYKKLYTECPTASPYRWFSLLAVFSILGQKDCENTDADNQFLEKITKDKKEPAVHKAQAIFCLGRYKYEVEKDRDGAIALFKQVIKIYDGMSRAELKGKLMNGGNQQGPTFTTVGAYRDDKDGAYSYACKFLVEVNANWESPKAKKKAAQRAAAEAAYDSDTTTKTESAASSSNILYYSAIAVTLSIAIYYFWPKNTAE
ncbi:hypothetical protein BDR26DRAFT_1016142 [Obelidium mucronatum]|nr:hypothetical protein BDR26DRAFT_1016142 [Obelidium mucronatum]